MSDTELPPQIRQRTVAKAHILLEALPFMQAHHGKVIVVKYGGAAMERAPLAASFAQDIALLQSAGILPVVVHGGGPQVTKMSASLGIETTFVDGVRVTDADTLDVATMVLAGKLNTEVVASLVTGGVPAVGLSGVDGGMLLARKQTAPDLGFVGEVVHVNADVVRTLMAQRFVPVVASIAVDEFGQAYNVNADVVAAELAIALDAEKLVFLNDVPGLIGPTGDLLSELSAEQCLDLLGQEGVVEGGMIPKLESAADAIKAGVGRVHLVDGRVEHSLVLELFTPEGVGTMITPDAGGPDGRRDAGMSRGNAAVKAKRQQTILSLVGRERLASQEEIRARLAALGLEATQSTISRDVEELGLARVHDHDGLRYVVPGNGAAPVPMRLLKRLLEEFALSFTRSDHGLVVRTPPGAASALAEGIDRVDLPDVAGTIAGDNTILILGREGVAAAALERTLNHIMEADA